MKRGILFTLTTVAIGSFTNYLSARSGSGEGPAMAEESAQNPLVDSREGGTGNATRGLATALPKLPQDLRFETLRSSVRQGP